MTDDATRLDTATSAARVVAPASLAGAVVGVFLTWTSAGPVDLNGTQGPNNGWLIVLVSAMALGWVHAMHRGSWVGVIGAIGSALVIGWTAAESWLDSRSALGATASYGLVLVVAASVALACSAALCAAELARRRRV